MKRKFRSRHYEHWCGAISVPRELPLLNVPQLLLATVPQVRLDSPQTRAIVHSCDKQSSTIYPFENSAGLLGTVPRRLSKTKLLVFHEILVTNQVFQNKRHHSQQRSKVSGYD
jgi:hypothetical protein